jgi:hypothetical protein
MSRLPDLERLLLAAAERIDAQASTATPDRWRVRRWRRRGTPLLVGIVGLAVAGGAIAAATGFLDSGDPVPPAPKRQQPKPMNGTKGFTLAGVRAPDPDGGPQWAIGTYEAVSAVTCVVVGRVQNGRLGVIGRDGVFGNDGRFHELAPAAQSSSVCSGRAKDGAFIILSSVPPIPASGYTGPPGTAIGGCRERVDLDGPTVSPQTRRKLRGVPQCSANGLRQVVAGFAGPRAASATLTGPGYRKTLKLQPRENGAYLFVMRATSGARPQLSITDRNGTVCEPFAGKRNGCPGLFQDG